MSLLCQLNFGSRTIGGEPLSPVAMRAHLNAYKFVTFRRMVNRRLPRTAPDLFPGCAILWKLRTDYLQPLKSWASVELWVIRGSRLSTTRRNVPSPIHRRGRTHCNGRKRLPSSRSRPRVSDATSSYDGSCAWGLGSALEKQPVWQEWWRFRVVGSERFASGR
jgi:hypothetical protein